MSFSRLVVYCRAESEVFRLQSFFWQSLVLPLVVVNKHLYGILNLWSFCSFVVSV